MDYLLHVLVFITMTAILAVSLNLIVGYTGMLSIAHASFYGIGSYVFAVLLVDHNFGFFSAAFMAVVSAMFAALIIGAILSRLRGDYFALASIGFNFIVYGILLNAESVTHGALGIAGISRPVIWGVSVDSTAQFLIFSAVTMALVYLCARFIVNSSFGRVLKAIREDENALQVFGYRTVFYKCAIFVIGGGLAAVTGVLFSSYITFIDPTLFKDTESVYLLSVVVLGGLGSLRGSLVGAIILQGLPEVFRFFGFPTEVAAQLRLFLYGLALVLLMVYRPRGIFGNYKF